MVDKWEILYCTETDHDQIYNYSKVNFNQDKF